MLEVTLEGNEESWSSTVPSGEVEVEVLGEAGERYWERLVKKREQVCTG